MNHKYVLEQFAGIRMPLAPEKDYYVIDEQTILNQVKIDHRLSEAISVASDSMMEALQREYSGKKYDNLVLSVLKYYIRSTTRSTPFGLFSGVGVVKYCNSTELSVILSDTDKRARIDMGWLYKYIEKILQNNEIKYKLRVSRNNLCYKNGDRFLNPYFTSGGVADNKANAYSSIRLTPPIAYIAETLSSPIRLCELQKQIEEKFNAPKEKISNFLDNLISNGYILPEIYPPSLNTNPLDYMINILEPIEEADKELLFLKNLKDRIIQYGKANGDSVSLFQDIRSCMQDRVRADNYLQVDCKLKTAGGISQAVGKEAERLADMLALLAPFNAEFTNLTKYKEEFLEKYGYCTEVPLIEMLDDVRGIGFPAGYINSKKEQPNLPPVNSRVEAVKALIKDKVILAAKNDESTVEVRQEELEEILKGTESGSDVQLLLSFDIFAELLGESEEKINDGNFQLALSGCRFSSGALNAFGRFADMFEEDELTDSEILSKEHKLLGSNYVIAELFEQAKRGTITNVNISKSGAEYQIAFDANPCKDKKVIGIDDIYIGVDPLSNAFYAKSKLLQKRIYARTTHMTNFTYGSSAFRFLRDISSVAGRFQMYDAIEAFQDNSAMYFPRIIYGRCILCPARYMLKGKLMENCGWDEWKERFSEWKEQIKLPRYVNMMEGDNYLRLDLERDIDRKLLYTYARKNDKLMLYEVLNRGKNLWLKDENGDKHCCEMTFSVSRKPAEENENSEILELAEKIKPEKAPFEEETARVLFPGEEGWYYFKLYGIDNRLEEFMSFYLKQFAEELEMEGITARHFFIRYRDSRTHIRVRFQVQHKKDNLFMERILKWLCSIREKGILSDFSLVPYEREVERYGGDELIEAAEEYFYYDSLFVEQLIKDLYMKDILIKEDELGIWSIAGLLNGFGLNHEEQEKLMSEWVNKEDERELFRKNEKGYRRCLTFTETDIPSRLYEVFDQRNAALSIYIDKVNNCSGEHMLTNYKKNIMSAVIHMFCNRFKADNIWEGKIRALTRHALHSYVETEKHRVTAHR